MQKDMTQGRPMTVLLRYTLPLLVGTLMQQMYSVVDAMIIGRFVGSDALAAVGSSATVVTLVNSIILGLCMGISIVTSQHFGARDTVRLKETVATSAVFLLCFAALLTALTHIFLGPLLVAYRMPEDIRPDATNYLRIIFSGLICTCCYNATAFLLRSVGDSRTPLLFLMLSMLLNIVLDLVLVLGLGMRVRGVAMATVFSQALSATCVMIYAGKKLDFLRGMVWKPVLRKDILLPIARYSIFTSLQQSIMNLGGLLVQGLVNSYGISVMAAFASGNKIDSFIHMPVGEFASALTTYIAQNRGAGRRDRIWSGLRVAMISVVAYCALYSTIVFFFKQPMLTMFVDPSETEILSIGTRYLSMVPPFYFCIGILSLFYGYYRGVGRPQISLVLTFFSMGTRVAMSYSLSAMFGDVGMIWWAIPLGWGLADLVGFTFLWLSRKSVTADLP